MYTVKAIVDSATSVASSTTATGPWFPARPDNYKYATYLQRIIDAWYVLTGKADAIVWPEGQ